jgi:predicted TPR repeat methyltransferase
MSADIEINTNKRNFDQEAANWDQVTGRVKVAHDIAQSMIQEIILTPDMDVLDFGCGTGLLTFALQPFVRSITGVDSSQGMLNVFKTKIKEQHLSNVKADPLDLDKGDLLEGSYDLIVCSMTLHHIKEIGALCIADLDLDDGKFHSNNDGVFHFGFDREALRRTFIDAGFCDVRHRAAAHVEKPVGGDKIRLFTMFLIIGRK